MNAKIRALAAIVVTTVIPLTTAGTAQAYPGYTTSVDCGVVAGLAPGKLVFKQTWDSSVAYNSRPRTSSWTASSLASPVSNLTTYARAYGNPPYWDQWALAHTGVGPLYNGTITESDMYNDGAYFRTFEPTSWWQVEGRFMYKGVAYGCDTQS